MIFEMQDQSQRVKGLTEHDALIDWRADSESLWLTTHHDENKTLPVAFVDWESGKRAEWREIKPSRPVEQVTRLRITPDGKAYAYNYIVKMTYRDTSRRTDYAGRDRPGSWRVVSGKTVCLTLSEIDGPAGDLRCNECPLLRA